MKDMLMGAETTGDLQSFQTMRKPDPRPLIIDRAAFLRDGNIYRCFDCGDGTCFTDGLCPPCCARRKARVNKGT